MGKAINRPHDWVGMDPREYFGGRRVAICFSGGIDSSYLLHVAASCGADVVAMYADTPFDRPEDRARAESVAEREGIELVRVRPELPPEAFANGPDRCYHCKRAIMGTIVEEAGRRGCDAVADGTNASDRWDDRPGMRALEELGIESPLRMWGLTKDDIRERSRIEGLDGWDLPSNSCVATRVMTGVPITAETLERVAEAERRVGALGFAGFRVRTDGKDAVLRVMAGDRGRAEAMMPEIRGRLSDLFGDVGLDDVVRERGWTDTSSGASWTRWPRGG